MSKRLVFVSLCAVVLAGCASKETGPQGLTGPAGPQGPAGPAGPQGASGAVLTRTVVVSPGTNPVASGTALRTAMDGISDAGGSNPSLLKIEPGIYDLGTDTLIMKPYVDVEGSGQGVTVLIASGSYGVNGAEHSELRNLSVESTGANPLQIAVQVVGTNGFVVDHVTATSSSSSATANSFAMAVGGDATVRDSTLIATASAGADALALYGNAGGTSHVSNSVLSGQTESMRGDPIFVSNSQIHGPATDATCVNSFNDAYVALGANCN